MDLKTFGCSLMIDIPKREVFWKKRTEWESERQALQRSDEKFDEHARAMLKEIT